MQDRQKDRQRNTRKATDRKVFRVEHRQIDRLRIRHEDRKIDTGLLIEPAGAVSRPQNPTLQEQSLGKEKQVEPARNDGIYYGKLYSNCSYQNV